MHWPRSLHAGVTLDFVLTFCLSFRGSFWKETGRIPVTVPPDNSFLPLTWVWGGQAGTFFPCCRDTPAKMGVTPRPPGDANSGQIPGRS